MTNKQIVARALKESGWFPKGLNAIGWINDDVVGFQCMQGKTVRYTTTWHITDILFNHEFAIALWGEGYAWFTEGTSGDTLPSGNYRNYIGHLANMVVADDKFKYLEQNIIEHPA